MADLRLESSVLKTPDTIALLKEQERLREETNFRTPEDELADARRENLKILIERYRAHRAGNGGETILDHLYQ